MRQFVGERQIQFATVAAASLGGGITRHRRIPPQQKRTDANGGHQAPIHPSGASRAASLERRRFLLPGLQYGSVVPDVLMTLYWVFALPAIAERSFYLSALANSTSRLEALAALTHARERAGVRAPSLSIPLP